jgi:hypothetical protein
VPQQAGKAGAIPCHVFGAKLPPKKSEVSESEWLVSATGKIVKASPQNPAHKIQQKTNESACGLHQVPGAIEEAKSSTHEAYGWCAFDAGDDMNDQEEAGGCAAVADVKNETDLDAAGSRAGTRESKLEEAHRPVDVAGAVFGKEGDQV